MPHFQIVSGNLIIAQGESKASCIAQLANAALPTLVEIESIDGSQRVTVWHKFWERKSITLPTTYGNDFSRREILSDIAEKICRMHGYRLQRVEEI